MRRALLCLLTLPFVLNLALAQAPDHRTPPPSESGYPPDKQEKATQTVLEKAKLLCGDWAV